MSLLRRTGTSRNNIEWYNTSNSSGNYLRRTNNGRNDISWLNISTSGTYNLLNRISNGINDIQWKNTIFSFFTPHTGTYKSSTTITIPSGCNHIDIFCVGGGGAGGDEYSSSNRYHYGGGGGGGGYTKTVSNLVVSAGQSISIVVGSGGKVNGTDPEYIYSGEKSYVSRNNTVLCTANGGNCGSRSGTINTGYSNGGSGGGAKGFEGNRGSAWCTGGNGGSNGGNGGYSANGSTTSLEPGKGQGTTTRAFGESSGTLYAGGGGGGGYHGGQVTGGSGGAGGGGKGGHGWSGGAGGTANTGGGGGGTVNTTAQYKAGAGGSGIVLIRFKI